MLSIKTDRLVLRDFSPRDFEAFFETTQDSEYQRFYSEKETHREFWESIFKGILASVKAERRLKFQLAMCLRSGEVVGTCGVRIEDAENRQASFGCAVARPYWGQGLAFEGSQRIIAYGFSELQMHRIYAETIRENTRARSLAEHLGMRLEGELRQNRFFRDRWWDTMVYGILEDEWESP